jgi:hypothetical protein
MISNILVGRDWTRSGVEHSDREGEEKQWCPILWKGESGLAVVSNILVGRERTSCGVQYSGREGVDWR